MATTNNERIVKALLKYGLVPLIGGELKNVYAARFCS